MFSTDTWLRIVCAIQVNAMLFGLGAVTVLSIPALADQAMILIPAVVVASFVLAPVIGSMIASRMRVRNWSRRGWREGDAISG
ncbi:hypothetical protein [Aquibium sp. ELW1220]|uniref:hypothetical protein n=1 Tax=Aquibium sp. ELW1220 TaxID=2976766 RepID=UPI0025B2547F|nr:hypothetical protein [Aquibium sp. ELW1220]MDN2580186.1 hypothetical protein [Aquibium sp. ELW1220]